ncbi:hypothetical protein SEA_WEST99_18 [Mycobacterium phage West99]|uniref:Uncharacterized protein n=15 Tax=Rosebushvirus TaxID=1982900 RepID=A0A0M4RD10_9CAUD|nr:gp18 [Mycobacterium phage Rosebush]AER47250.1 hypothetical protein HEDGEROW_18 [Mycobacterium phage Hedgerow]AER48640.1 hypothetical protein ARES_18 [Mycobacterium phage Ares]ALF01303.1 hypothetical protein SEA_TRES_18 [Mycobacterium phage Tres]AUX82298.1 hypothetical protein SEA_ITSYBITSY1_18 [Mycobacterium phage ItsyBitsy1]AXQ52495.1 hypothetical protein SEA_FRENCHFRY_18 [Mycobacterium phage FrenchFry]AYB69067.1 hypothetical protein SEA_EAGLEHORSE_18 [Mycobacterium phage Eaglehorse]QBZ7
MDAASHYVARPVFAPGPTRRFTVVSDRAAGDVMTSEERLALADKLAAEYTRHIDYIRTQTVLFGLLPLFYGILTFVFGDDLWAGGVVYSTALQVPYAPQSWGVAFIVMGLGVIVNAWYRRQRLLVASCMLTALILSMFMVTFLTEVVVSDNLSGLPPGVVYGIFSLSFMNRARLAWNSRG